MPTNDVGINYDGENITGLKLVLVSYGTPFQEARFNFGTVLICNLPVNGLEKGCYYEIIEKCVSTDWESGNCDETELFANKVLNAK